MKKTYIDLDCKVVDIIDQVSELLGAMYNGQVHEPEIAYEEIQEALKVVKIRVIRVKENLIPKLANMKARITL